jgi:hypothetical protein
VKSIPKAGKSAGRVAPNSWRMLSSLNLSQNSEANECEMLLSSQSALTCDPRVSPKQTKQRKPIPPPPQHPNNAKEASTSFYCTLINHSVTAPQFIAEPNEILEKLFKTSHPKIAHLVRLCDAFLHNLTPLFTSMEALFGFVGDGYECSLLSALVLRNASPPDVFLPNVLFCPVLCNLQLALRLPLRIDVVHN